MLKKNSQKTEKKKISKVFAGGGKKINWLKLLLLLIKSKIKDKVQIYKIKNGGKQQK